MTETQLLLAQNAPAWAAATTKRRSRRRYDGRYPSLESLSRLEETAQRFRPWDDARVVVLERAPEALFTGLVGSYGRITGSPSALLFAGSGSGARRDAHVGYTGEALVLEATALGLDTCWIAGAFDRRLADTLPQLEPGETVLAISALGYATDEVPLGERVMRSMARAHRRKDLAAIAPGLSDAWPRWARRGVELARLAPSAVNRQPWRFSMSAGSLVVSASGVETPTVARQLDCGIAMLHVSLGALEEDVTGDWTDLSENEVARFEPQRT